jgi:hypothetical protein
LKDLGIGIIFEKENINTLDAKGEVLLTILSSLAQDESRSISENCTRGVGSSDAVLWKIRKIGMLYHKMLWFEGKNWSKK